MEQVVFAELVQSLRTAGHHPVIESLLNVGKTVQASSLEHRITD
jgi:hypothetical protein